MEQSGTDRRVRKTKSQLRLALMELLVEKSAKNISVRELAERADINRGTFYIHYRDVGDLLQRLEEQLAFFQGQPDKPASKFQGVFSIHFLESGAIGGKHKGTSSL